MSDYQHQSTPDTGGKLMAPPRSRIYSTVIKRVLDIAISLLILPVCFFLIAIFWVLTRRDGGQGFFAQPRVGRNGRVFNCWKLRTMVVDAERVLKDMCDADPALAAEWRLNQKLAHDPRITRCGAFLRATSLDELPQIWNVLRGDMSLVGPRPMLPSQQDLYVSGGGGEAYFRLRPGITGPWQVDGRATSSFLDRVRYDNAYFRDLSLSGDLNYLFRTVGVVFRRTGT